MNAATTMIAGKNETNAFAPSATLRSMNSFSSIRSQMRQKIVLSAHFCSSSDKRAKALVRLEHPGRQHSARRYCTRCRLRARR